MNFKVKAFLKIIAGVIGFILALYFMYSGGPNPTGGFYYLAAIAAPGGLALIGVLELVTGKEFTKLAEQWDTFSAWKKLIISIFVIAAAICILFLSVYIFGEQPL